MKRLLLALCLLPALALHADAWRNGSNPNSMFPNATSPIGINLDPVNYYDGQYVFNNLFQSAAQYGVGSGGFNGHVTNMPLDANGWLTSSYRGYDGTIYTDGVGINATISAGIALPVPTQTLNISCTGTATLTFNIGASGTVSCPATNSAITTTTTSISQLQFTITGMDLTANGSYLTALSIVRSDRTYTAGNYSTYFNPDFLSAIKYARVLRMLNWDPVIVTGISTWSERPTPAQPFYGSTSAIVYGNSQIIPPKIPLELEVSLANQLNASLWSNFPCSDDGTYATNTASYVSGHLNQSWYAEFCNEIWNTGTPVSGYARAAGAIMFPYTIAGIVLGNPTQVTFPPQQGVACANMNNGATLTVEGIVTGPTDLNGNTYTIVNNTISAATWGSSQATFTVNTNPSVLSAGQTITVSGVSPSGYNGTWTVVSSSSTQIVVTMVSNPGAYSSGGTVNQCGGASGGNSWVTLNVNTLGDTAWSSGGGLQVNNNTGIAQAWAVQQSAAEMDLVKAAWTASTSKLFRVYGAQAAGGSPDSTLALGCGAHAIVCTFANGAQSSSHFDVIAYAPYEAYGLPISWSADSTGLTSAFTEMNTGGALPTGSGANTTSGSGANTPYTLTSSSLCGNGSIASTPANETLTCAVIGSTCSGQPTLTVDGGTTYNIYYVSNSSGANFNACTTKGLNSGTTYDFEFVTQTGAAAWSSSTTYGSGVFVSGSDTNTYLSLAGSNLNHNPVGDGNVHWQVLTPAWFVTQSKGQAGGFVATVGIDLAYDMGHIAEVGANFQAIVSYEMGLDFGDTGPNAIQNLLYNAATTDSRMQAHYSTYYFPQFSAAGQTGIINHYSGVGDITDNGLYPYRQGVYNSILGKELGIIQFIQANPKVSLP